MNISAIEKERLEKVGPDRMLTCLVKGRITLAERDVAFVQLVYLDDRLEYARFLIFRSETERDRYSYMTGPILGTFPEELRQILNEKLGVPCNMRIIRQGRDLKDWICEWQRGLDMVSLSGQFSRQNPELALVLSSSKLDAAVQRRTANLEDIRDLETRANNQRALQEQKEVRSRKARDF